MSRFVRLNEQNPPLVEDIYGLPGWWSCRHIQNLVILKHNLVEKFFSRIYYYSASEVFVHTIIELFHVIIQVLKSLMCSSHFCSRFYSSLTVLLLFIYSERINFPT